MRSLILYTFSVPSLKREFARLETDTIPHMHHGKISRYVIQNLGFLALEKLQETSALPCSNMLILVLEYTKVDSVFLAL